MKDNAEESGYIPRILLGIDGNCAYALHGATFEDGDSEFAELTSREQRWSGRWIAYAKRRAVQAGNTLTKRLKLPVTEFVFDGSLSPDNTSD